MVPYHQLKVIYLAYLVKQALTNNYIMTLLLWVDDGMKNIFDQSELSDADGEELW